MLNFCGSRPIPLRELFRCLKSSSIKISVLVNEFDFRNCILSGRRANVMILFFSQNLVVVAVCSSDLVVVVANVVAVVYLLTLLTGYFYPPCISLIREGLSGGWCFSY